MTQSQQSPLSTFDPFATHPFTNTHGLIPRPPHPSKYARGVNPSFSHHPPAPSTPPTPPSGNSQPPTPPIVAPLPMIMTPPSVTTPKSSSKGIFYTYTPDRRGTPELEDILVKKRPQKWATK